MAAAAAVVVRNNRDRKSGPERQSLIEEGADVVKNLRKSLAMPKGCGHRNELHDIVGHHECYSKPTSGTATSDDEDGGAELPYSQQVLLNAIHHKFFDPIAASVIILNAFVMGLSAEFALQFHKENPEATHIKSNGFVQGISYFFFAFYAIELLMKAGAFRFSFFTGRDWKWNTMDLLLVITAIYDIIEQETDFGGSNVSFLRLLRLLKMVKMLRLFRVMKFFRELRVMMYAIVGSLRLLFWAIVMLGIITYIFGLIFLQGVNFKLTEENLEQDIRDNLLLYYGSVPLSMITLYEAITGGNDWSPLAEPLKPCGMGYYYLFLFYIAFLSVLVLNVLTGVVVDAAMMIAQLDGDNVTDEFIGKEIMNAENLRALTDAIELNGNGYIEWDEVVSDSATETMREFLTNIDVDFEEVEGFFRLMQCQSVKGQVKVRDFIKGCANMKLWGPSKSIESYVLMRNLTKLRKHVDANFQRVLACFERQGVDIPPMSEVKVMDEVEEDMFDGWDEEVPAGISDATPLILSGEWEQLFDGCNDAQVLKSVGERAARRVRELQQGGSLSKEMKADRSGAGQSAQFMAGTAQELVSRLAGLIVQEATPLLLQELENNAKAFARPGARDEPEPKMIGTPMDAGGTSPLDTEGDDSMPRTEKSSTGKKFGKKKVSRKDEKAAQAETKSSDSVGATGV